MNPQYASSLPCRNPVISPGENFATFLKHEIFPGNYPRLKFSLPPYVTSSEAQAFKGAKLAMIQTQTLQHSPGVLGSPFLIATLISPLLHYIHP